MSFAWGYGQNNGPHVWADHWDIAKNPKYGQSPINIEKSQAKLKTDWPQPSFSYRPDRCSVLKNTGKSFQVDVEPCEFGNKDDVSFKGGPLKHNYGLAQFHFHWGKDDTEGSEHTIDGQSFALEGHLVHYNKDLFKTVGDAIDKPGGLSVCGVFFKAGKPHAGIQKLIDLFDSIGYAGDTQALADGYNPEWLLPEAADRNRYWHYYGSLTTPPLFESVNWIVFQEVQEVSSEQLARLRELCSFARDGTPLPDDEFCGKICQNFRPALTKNFATKDKATGAAKRIERQLYTTSN